VRKLLTGQLKPMLRILLAFGLVWFVNGVSAPYFAGGARFLVVVVVSFGLWVIVMRTLFPARPDDAGLSRGDPP